MQPHKTKLWRY